MTTLSGNRLGLLGFPHEVVLERGITGRSMARQLYVCRPVDGYLCTMYTFSDDECYYLFLVRDCSCGPVSGWGDIPARNSNGPEGRLVIDSPLVAVGVIQNFINTGAFGELKMREYYVQIETSHHSTITLPTYARDRDDAIKFVKRTHRARFDRKEYKRVVSAKANTQSNRE